MKIIFVNSGTNKERDMNLSPLTAILGLLLFTCFIMVVGAWFGYLSGVDEVRNSRVGSYHDLYDLLEGQRKELVLLQEDGKHHIDALAIQLGHFQARLTRLNSLALQLAEQAGLKGGDELSGIPALGGLGKGVSEADIQAAELLDEMAQLDRSLMESAWKLDLLEALLVNRKLQMEMTPAGKPIKRGIVTSGFGARRDPFSGAKDFHRGIDFQARPGTKVFAVASGVVSYSGVKGGYGNIVEIRHANGLQTRYAHNKKNLVKQGEPVLKGQTIALLGSTGRSSGPHVHFEVVKNGVAINPIKFIQNK